MIRARCMSHSLAPTDMASALLEKPAIAERKVRVVWIGGQDWPVGGWEYNLWNDVAAANVVFRSKVELWQIPSTIYKRMAVSYAELGEKVYDKGPLGKYLVEQLVEWNKSYPHDGHIEHRSLGDSPAIGVMMYPECGWSEWRPAPEFKRCHELCAHRTKSPHPRLPCGRSKVYPRRLFCQIGTMA